MPSPVCLISLPPWALRASRMTVLCCRRMSWALASPSRWVRAVEPSMSVKRMVTRPEGACAGVGAGSLAVPTKSSIAFITV